ncbi:unnamed protein product [Urochloa humidicola]
MSGSLGGGAPQGRRARRSNRDGGRARRRPDVALSRFRGGGLHRAAADPDPVADFMATASRPPLPLPPSLTFFPFRTESFHLSVPPPADVDFRGWRSGGLLLRWRGLFGSVELPLTAQTLEEWRPAQFDNHVAVTVLRAHC